MNVCNAWTRHFFDNSQLHPYCQGDVTSGMDHTVSNTAGTLRSYGITFKNTRAYMYGNILSEKL